MPKTELVTESLLHARVPYTHSRQELGYFWPGRVTQVTGRAGRAKITSLTDFVSEGIGKQLMAHAVRDLRSRSFDSMIAWVLAENPSRHFYQKLRGEHAQTREITIGGMKLKEYGYGCKNLDSIPDSPEFDIKSI